MADFIRPLLIRKITELVKEKESILKNEGFLFLDKNVEDKKKIKKTINRVNRNNIYPKEEVLPISWYSVSGSSLLEIYSQLKDNSFYIYKIINGKSHKMRIKKR